MNLDEIKADIYRQCRYPSAPSPDIQTRIASLVNDTHAEVCAAPGLERLRDDVIAVVAKSSVSRSSLPPAVARIQGITDRTHSWVLRQVPLHQLRITDPGQSSTSSYPIRYAVVSNQPVLQQPAAATGLWAVSSAAGDTTQKVYVESVITGGFPSDVLQNGTILTGATRVAIGSRTDHVEVTKFYTDMPCAGFVSLYDAAAAGNELARLPIGATYSRYTAIEWEPIPSADVTLYADVTRAIYPLVKGTDEPLIPDEFHQVIVDGSLYREWTILGDSRAGIAKVNFDAGVKQLRTWVMGNGDRIASFRPVAPRWNRLGAQYPAEGWPY